MALIEWEGTKPFDFQPVLAGLLLRPGEYRRILSDGKPSARACCPVCGWVATLDHEIDAQGNVTPSVQCANPQCKFHAEPVRLLQW